MATPSRRMKGALGAVGPSLLSVGVCLFALEVAVRWNDGHPNPEGHEFIADSLVDYTLTHPALSAEFGLER